MVKLPFFDRRAKRGAGSGGDGPPPGVPERRSRVSRVKRRLKKIPHPHLPHLTLTQVRLFRLFSLLFVFALLVLYAVFRSPHFQELMRRKSERLLTGVLHRDVKIGGFDLSLVPPAFVVRDIVIANDPRGIAGPFFSASEVELRGIPEITKQRIDLPKVRVFNPKVVVEVFPDGTTNLPIPTSGTKGGGVDVRLRELILQRGTFRFREWRAQLDVRLKDTAITGRSGAFSQVTHATLACRHGEFRLSNYDVQATGAPHPLEFALAVDATLAPGRLHFDGVRLRSDRLSVDASGGIEDLAHPVIALAASAVSTGRALDELFGVGLPLEGDVFTSGTLRIAPGEGFRARGRFEIPKALFGPFPMSGSGFARVDPSGVLAHVTKGEYAGGSLEAVVRVGRLKDPPLPARLLIKARGVDFESFFADLGLHGTGMKAKADLDTTLTFDTGQTGLEHANGAGSIRFTPVPGVPSAVRGRHALPTSGGGPLLVRNGKILFARTPFQTAGGAKISVDGSLTIGSWAPDFTIEADADDLAEVERLADNFYAAIQKEPLEPKLKLAGSGHVEGHLVRSFSDPLVTGRIAASDFVLRGVRFGETTAEYTVDRNVLTLSPFVSSDAGGSLTLTGNLGWGGPLHGSYRLAGFTADFVRWPIERVMSFLDFDLPLTGPVTGGLPLEGVTPNLEGSVALVWEDATAWGQKADRVEGRLEFARDHLVIDGLDAKLADGRLKGSATYRYRDRAYEFVAEAHDLPVSALVAVKKRAGEVTGTFDGTLQGKGTVDHPGLTLDGTLKTPGFEGRSAPGPLKLAATLDREALSASAEAPTGRIEVKSTGGAGAPMVLDVRVSDLSPFRELLGLPEDTHLGGALAGQVRFTSDEKGYHGEGTVQNLAATLDGQTFTAAHAPFFLEGHRVRFEKFTLTGAGPAPAEGPSIAGDLSLSGFLSLERDAVLDVTLKGVFDAAFLDKLLEGSSLQGKLAVDAHLTGTAKKPIAAGRVSFDGVDLVPAGGGTPFESISGTLLLAPGRVTADALSLRYGGGSVDVSGALALDGLEMKSIRLNTHLTRVKARPFEGFRATVTGDLFLRGDTTLRTAEGKLELVKGLYDQDVDLGLGSLLNRMARGSAAPAVRGRFDDVDLNIGIDVPTSAIEIRNNVARVKLSGSLLAQGTLGRPILYGYLEAEEGGRLVLRDHRYEVTIGKILFSNSVEIDPFYELEARTTIRASSSGDYEVTLGLTGTSSKLVPRLSSDPPLSDAQIVSLLVSGDLPGTNAAGVPVGTAPVSSDVSVQTATSELIASLLTSEAAARAKNFFRLDRLQIDPVFVGSTFDAPRVTVGKSLSKNLSVTYSYKAAANTETLLVVEYQISPNAYLQAVRDETGVYSLDLKLRQRLR